jgi:rhodanese-related sulfurtransferase
LKTDYIDLYWIHVWDSVTPPEELLTTMSALVASGKIRYWGMSNTPAWYVARIVTLADASGRPGPIALQYFYSLVSREIEAEHVPLARDTGLGVMPWSPLAYGLLTGKYDRATVEAAPSRSGGLPNEAGNADGASQGGARLDGANPFGDTLFTDRNWTIVDRLKSVASEIGEPPAKAVVLESNGVRLCVEPRAWKRADGISIDYVETPEGTAFKIDNPNEPARVRPISPKEFDERRRSGEALRLIDVRTPAEWDTARIPGAELLDADLMAGLQELPRDTVLVFQCHHGHRSQRAAEQFPPLGFTRVYNLSGGIDAYSESVDPSIPRY